MGDKNEGKVIYLQDAINTISALPKYNGGYTKKQIIAILKALPAARVNVSRPEKAAFGTKLVVVHPEEMSLALERSEMTLRQAAREIGVDVAILSKVINGKYYPTKKSEAATRMLEFIDSWLGRHSDPELVEECEQMTMFDYI